LFYSNCIVCCDYTVSLSGNAAKWAVAAPSGFSLGAGETDVVYVYATPSLNALPGEYELRVTVIGTSGASRTVVNTLTVENCHGAALASTVDLEETCAGLPGQFSLTLTNEGSFSETFELTLSGDGARYASLSNNLVNLASGESRELLVNVNTNDVGLYGLTVTAQSQDTGVIAIEKLSYNALGCYDFALNPEKSYFSFCESTEVKIPVVIENKGSLANNYQLVVDGPKWATVENTDVTIPAGSSTVVNLVLFPGYGVEGDFKVEVQAVGQEGGVSTQKEVIANVLECHETSLEIPMSEDTVCPFTEESYEVSLANLGEYPEHYLITVTGADWVGSSSEFVDINAGESEKFTLDISPANVATGQYVLKMNAESQDSCHTANSDIIAINIASRDNCFGVQLEAQHKSVDVVYGEGALVPVVVENKGTQESKYNLEVSGTGASYVQLNPSTVVLSGGESETVYLYISMPEQTPKSAYSITVAARLEDGTLSDSDIVEVRLLAGEARVELPQAEEEEEVERESGEGVTTKVRGIVGNVIAVGTGGVKSVGGLLVSKTAGFSNWMILVGLVVLIGIVYMAWKYISELDRSTGISSTKKEKKGLWQRFIDFLEEDDDEWNLGKKNSKKK
jgi:uncharacterized membrane protein